MVEFVGDIDTIDTFSYKTTMIQLENTIENVSEKKTAALNRSKRNTK